MVIDPFEVSLATVSAIRDVDSYFVASVFSDNGVRVVRVGGELDIATRTDLFGKCLAGKPLDVVVDMADLRFMDCGGYGGLLAISVVLSEQGGSLTWRNHTGQPARLLALIANLN